MIYNNLFDCDGIAHDKAQALKQARGLLYTCSRIFVEALPVFNDQVKLHINAVSRGWDTSRQKDWETRPSAIGADKYHWYEQVRPISLYVDWWRKVLSDLHALEKLLCARRSKTAY